MKKSKAQGSTPDLKKVKKQFDKWREVRRPREAIPPELWSAAVALTHRHSITRVSRHLKLNYKDLKNKANAPGGQQEASPTVSFVEIPWQGQANGTDDRPVCVIEVQRHGGDRMKLSLYGETQATVDHLVRVFWGEKR